MQPRLRYDSKWGSPSAVSVASAVSTIVNLMTHLNVGLDVGSYYHCLSLLLMALCSICFRGCHGSLRIFLLLVNYMMNIHLFCHYYDALSTASIVLLILSSTMLIIIAFIKLYHGRRVFMETCFTTTIVFYILLNFYIFTYYMLSYYQVDRYMSLDKLVLSLSLWMVCCWNVNINDLRAGGGGHHIDNHNRLTITAILGIISQAIFLLRFIPFIMEYNAEDIPLIILIILCIHIGSVLIIFLCIDLANELRSEWGIHKVTKQTLSFGFSLILSIWVEYLLLIFYFAVYFVMSFNVENDQNFTVRPLDGELTSDLVHFGLIAFGRYNFILLSIPGSIPFVMIVFANYRRENIYKHMVFTQVFEKWTSDLPQHSVLKITDILGRNININQIKSWIPIPVPTTVAMDQIVDKLFGIVYLFGSDHDDSDKDNERDCNQSVHSLHAEGEGAIDSEWTELREHTESRNVNGSESLSVLQKQYQYLKLKESEKKYQFIVHLMKRYIEKQGIRINMGYKLLFYHENIAVFLSICFGISRFISCILMPIVWCYIMKDLDNDITSMYVVQHWIVYFFIALYGLSVVPFVYNLWCVMNCEYYFFLITPLKEPKEWKTESGLCVGDRYSSTQRGAINNAEQLLPRFIRDSRRNKVIWEVMENKDIATIIIQFLPNATCL